MPDIAPMLAHKWPEPFDGQDWLFELKWDGYRCLMYIGSSQLLLRSRNGNPLNHRFPQLESVTKAVKRDFRNLIVDGEIVVFKGGKPDFASLKTNPGRAVYIAFDLLYLNDQALLEVPLVDRRYELFRAFAWNHLIYFSEALEAQGRTLFELVRSRDLEGMVAKRKYSLYFPGKQTHDWLKIKNFKEIALWVVGYFPSPGRKIGSLLVAREVSESAGAVPGGPPAHAQQDTGTVHDSVHEVVFRQSVKPKPRRLVLMGRVSTGLDQETEDALEAAFSPPAPHPLAQVEGKLSKQEQRDVRWVKPFFGVRVQYTEITPEGRLRHPVLKEVVW